MGPVWTVTYHAVTLLSTCHWLGGRTDNELYGGKTTPKKGEDGGIPQSYLSFFQKMQKKEKKKDYF